MEVTVHGLCRLGAPAPAQVGRGGNQAHRPTAGFCVVPKRWVVERTLAWLTQHRRLVRDYERSEASATAWIYVALIRIMLRRLA